jgi:SanA protein
MIILNEPLFISRFLKRWWVGSAAFILVGAVAVLVCDSLVKNAAGGKVYTEVNAVPHHRVALLLGTSKYMQDGRINLYYAYRIEAAVALLQSGKADYMVVSGDNSTHDYNEPRWMRDDLVCRGIDSSRIFMDYAGFRTLDSVVRLKEIFNQNEAIIVSQPFHNERALFLAMHEDIHAVAFNARDVEAEQGWYVQAREKLARVKMFLDILTSRGPKFLGPQVPIPQ